jgi:hypothetical protein
MCIIPVLGRVRSIDHQYQANVDPVGTAHFEGKFKGKEKEKNNES